MQDKQKVTLYLPPSIHRQLKIRAALDAASMSALVEKAVVFLLENPELVEEGETAHGKTHQVHICPECDSALVMREGQMVALKNQPSVISDELPPELQEQVQAQTRWDSLTEPEEALVPC
jgi:hypothetical protein